MTVPRQGPAWRASCGTGPARSQHRRPSPRSPVRCWFSLRPRPSSRRPAERCHGAHPLSSRRADHCHEARTHTSGPDRLAAPEVVPSGKGREQAIDKGHLWCPLVGTPAGPWRPPWVSRLAAGRCAGWRARRLVSGRAPRLLGTRRGASARGAGAGRAARDPEGQADRGGARPAPGPGGRAGRVGAAVDGRVGAVGVWRRRPSGGGWSRSCSRRGGCWRRSRTTSTSSPARRTSQGRCTRAGGSSRRSPRSTSSSLRCGR